MGKITQNDSHMLLRSPKRTIRDINSKKIKGNDHELIQSNPSFCPQNQKEKEVYSALIDKSSQKTNIEN